MSKLRSIATCAGALLLLATIGFIVYIRWDRERAAVEAARTSQLLHEQINTYTIRPKDDTEYTPKSATPTASDVTPGNAASDTNEPAAANGVVIEEETYIGFISIPVLGLELPVNQSWDYSKMKNTPCRYLGDVDSGLIITAHNYPAHFGSISKLEDDSIVVFMDVTGNEYQYRVDDVFVLQATDVEKLENSPYDLTLFTCTVGGEARVVVRCEKI